MPDVPDLWADACSAETTAAKWTHRPSQPEICEQEELDALFAACSPEERLRYEFFLMTGMRDQEVMHTYWSDINFKACTVRVSHKPDRGWTPKHTRSAKSRFRIG